MIRSQFNLLQSSLNPSLQSSTLSLILSPTPTASLSPSEIAVLPSSRLASQARFDADQEAQREILRQTVRVKDASAGGGLRVGPDGFESVVDVRELQLQREREREEEGRREVRRKREEREREEEKRYGLVDDAAKAEGVERQVSQREIDTSSASVGEGAAAGVAGTALRRRGFGAGITYQAGCGRRIS